MPTNAMIKTNANERNGFLKCCLFDLLFVSVDHELKTA